MKRSKSSVHWIEDHENDEYVQRARREGYRSRAVYKLLEIQDKEGIIKAGMTVVDLGAAPGGWSQVVEDLVGGQGNVIASDILPMEGLAGVKFLQGDFTEDAVFKQLLSMLPEEGADLVLSDMAPNMSGMRDIDQPRAIHLAELALDMARSILKPGAYFLVKTFQGAGFEEFQRETEQSFKSVKARKPRASRARSREIYLLASDFDR